MNNKQISFLIGTFCLLIVLPINVAHGVVQTINGQTGSTQTFSNDSNVGITSSGNTHALNWTGVLPVSRGGTGSNAFATGSIPFFWNGKLSENNSNFFWDNNSGTLNSLSIKIGNGLAGGNTTLLETDPLYTFVTVRGDIRLPHALGSIVMRDNADTTDWAYIYAYAPNSIGLENSLTGTTAVMDISEIDTGDKIFKFPNHSGTFALVDADQIWSGDNTFSKGSSATTTVNFGEVGDSSSRSCFNTKNTAGDDISFYFEGTSMIVESNLCK